MTQPINPKDVVAAKQASMPDEVIEVFNELIGVMDTAPKDHYDKESRAIAFHMSGDCNTSDFLDVSQEIYIVLAYWFGKNQIVESDCLAPAKKIVEGIGTGK